MSRQFSVYDLGLLRINNELPTLEISGFLMISNFTASQSCHAFTIRNVAPRGSKRVASQLVRDKFV
jgi:hypothetical protein